MRICFFGDSFVNGTGDDDALGWTGRVVAAARRRGLDVTSYNLGIRRDTSADIEARWRQETEARFRGDAPKRLAFAFGTNDCVEDGRGGPRVPQETALSNASRILEEAILVAPTIMIGPAPVLDDDATDYRVGRLSERLSALCAGMDIPFLETVGFLTNCTAWRREASDGDGTHPNREGYAALAAFIEEWPAFRAWIDGSP